jgi:hypothetical protein
VARGNAGIERKGQLGSAISLATGQQKPSEGTASFRRRRGGFLHSASGTKPCVKNALGIIENASCLNRRHPDMRYEFKKHHLRRIARSGLSLMASKPDGYRLFVVFPTKHLNFGTTTVEPTRCKSRTDGNAAATNDHSMLSNGDGSLVILADRRRPIL